jgi:hypothetical protein
VVEKAVDFMDAGEEFAREMGKLRAMGKWRWGSQPNHSEWPN